MTLSELIIELQDLADQAGDHDPVIYLATQPSWPLEESVSQVMMNDPMQAFYEEYGSPDELPVDDEEHAEAYAKAKEQAEQAERRVYFAGGFGGGYLQSGMASALGWR